MYVLNAANHSQRERFFRHICVLTRAWSLLSATAVWRISRASTVWTSTSCWSTRARRCSGAVCATNSLTRSICGQFTSGYTRWDIIRDVWESQCSGSINMHTWKILWPLKKFNCQLCTGTGSVLSGKLINY
jgi:hypothetical protein